MKDNTTTTTTTTTTNHDNSNSNSHNNNGDNNDNHNTNNHNNNNKALLRPVRWRRRSGGSWIWWPRPLRNTTYKKTTETYKEHMFII